MQSVDPNPGQAACPGVDDATPGPAAAVPAKASPVAGVGLVRLWAVTLVGGLVAGLAAWLVGEAAHDVFRPATAEYQLMGRGTVTTVTSATQAEADRKNAVLASSAWGAAIGLAFGLAGGRSRRCWGAATRAAALGVILGTVAGSFTALALVPAYYRTYRDRVPEGLAGPLLIHGAIWSAIGGAGGLAYGSGLGGGRARMARALLGGLMGGALGAVVSELVGAWAYPLARTYQPVAASSGARLMVALVIAILAAAGAALAVADPRARPR